MDQQKIDTFHQRASDHYMRGDYKKALDVWKRVLEIDPLDEKALEGVRLSSLLEGGVDHPLDSDPSEAGPRYEDPPDALRRRLDEVEKRIATGDFHEALRAAEMLRSERPTDPDVLSALARACLAAGEADQAAHITSQLLSLDPAYAEAAQLLEECRQLSPPQSPLGSVVLREAPELRPAAVSMGVAPVDSLPGFEPHSFLEELIAPAAPEKTKTVSPPARGEEKGLAPLSPAESAALARPSADPATTVLKQRVHDLLRQANEAAESGRKDDALGLLSRLLILDDQNIEAMALDEKLRQEAGESARSSEEWLNEGVQCLEQGQAGRARELFLRVLEAVPDHREAVDYLDRAEARLQYEASPRVGMPKEAGGLAGPPARGHVWQAPQSEPEIPTAELSGPILPVARLERKRERAATSVAQHRPRRRWLSPTALVVAGGVALLATGAVLAWRHFVGEDTATPKAALTPPPAVATQVAPPEATARSTQEPASEGTAAKRTPEIGDAIRRAEAAMESGRFEAAILAYNEVLSLAPDNANARKRLLEAGDLYRKNKIEIDKLERARRGFAQGEYEAALGVFYRLSPGLVGPAALNGYKVNGWYNLGIVSLRAANCAQAASQLGEALALDASDAGVRSASALAEACPNQQKDRAYYDTVGRLPFRSLEE